MTTSNNGTKNNGTGWWKGSFPLWIVVILLGMVSFFLQREIRANDARHETTAKSLMDLKLEMTELKVRTAWMENSLRDQKILLEKIDNQLKPLWRP